MSENNTQTQQQVQALRTLQQSYDALATASAAGAKETSVKDGNDTAVSVGKDIRSEVGTGSDTASETGTLFAVVKWVKDKVKSIANYIGTPASGQPSTLFAAIAAGGGGGGDAQESTSQAILANTNTMINNHIVNGVSMDGYVFSGIIDPAPINLVLNRSNIISITDTRVVAAPIFYQQGLGNLAYVSFPNATTVTANNFVRNQTYLEEVNMPMLMEVQGFGFCTGCSNLKVVYVPKLYSIVANNNNFDQCPNLIDFTIGENFNLGIPPMGTWNPTNALRSDISTLVNPGETFANNLEKLLYNIREHIAALLPDLTGQTAKTITFSAAVKAAIQADTATSNAFTNKNWYIA